MPDDDAVATAIPDAAAMGGVVAVPPTKVVTAVVADVVVFVAPDGAVDADGVKTGAADLKSAATAAGGRESDGLSGEAD